MILSFSPSYMCKALITKLWVYKYTHIKYFVNFIFETFLLALLCQGVLEEAISFLIFRDILIWDLLFIANSISWEIKTVLLWKSESS